MTLCINLLKALALKAENEGRDSINEVEYGYEIDCEDESLNHDEKLLVNILQEQKCLASSALYGFYSQRTRYPKGERSFRNYMQDLCLRGLVKSIGDKRGRVYEIIEQAG